MKKTLLLFSLFLFPTQAQSWVQVAQLAQTVTVQVNPSEGYGGTGVIVAKDGTTYYVLTNHHVACLRPGEQNSCVIPGTIRTYRGKSYPVSQNAITSLQKNADAPDLALLAFSSKENYPVVSLGDSNLLEPGVDVILAGYPVLPGREGEQRQIRLTTGFIAAIEKGSRAGYGLKYDAKAWWGNSGSPIFDHQGKLIGIHGQTEVAFNPIGATKTQTGINEGIPINFFRRNWRNLSLASGGNYQVNFPKTATGIYKQAIISYQQQKYQTALKSFDQVLQLDPNYDDAYLFRGHTKFAQNDKEGAIEDYDRFIQKNPQTALYRLKNRRPYFINLPQLLGAETTFYETSLPNPTYFYYIKVPDRVGSGIKTIEIFQEEGSEVIDYNPDSIVVKGIETIPFTTKLAGKKLTIYFAKPVEIPQTITLAISPYRNPDLSGIYQFRVTAFPGGELPRGQFLGYARFNFERPYK